MTPATDIDSPLPFAVRGDPSDTPQVEFEAVLDAVTIDVGDQYQCLIGTCGTTVRPSTGWCPA
jgi:hypothetical protein